MAIQSAGESTNKIVQHETLESRIRTSFMLEHQKDAIKEKIINPEVYIEQHKNEYNAYKVDYINSLQAGELGPSSIQTSKIFLDAVNKNATSRFPQIEPKKLAVLQDTWMPIAQAILDNYKSGATRTVNTGTQLQLHAINMDKKLHYGSTHEFGVFADMASQKKAYENIISGKTKGLFTEFDIEGIGKYITEMSFSRFNMNESRNNGFLGATGWILGLDNKAVSEMKALVSRARKGNNPYGYSDSERYMLESLAKAGNSKTEVAKDKNGYYYFKKYAADEDVKLLNFDDMLKGISLFEKVNNEYENAGQQLFEYNGSQFNVQKKYLPLLESLKNLKTSGQTLVTQNGFGYDMPQVMGEISRVGGDSLKALRSMVSSGDINDIAPHLDVVAVLREKNPWLLSDMSQLEIHNMLKAGGLANSSQSIAFKFNGPNGTGEQLEKNVETAMNAVLGEMGYVPHAATSDTVKQGFTTINALMSKTGIFNKDSKNFVFNKYDEKTRALQVGDMFIAKRGSFENSAQGLLSFTYDSGAGELRFNAGAKIDTETGIGKNDIVTHHGIKKDTMFMVSSVMRYDPDPETAHKLSEIAPTSGASNLYVVALKEVNDYHDKNERLSPTATRFFVGTEQQIKAFVGSNIFVGTQNKERLVNQKIKEAEKELKRPALEDQDFIQYNIKKHKDKLEVIDKKTREFAEKLFREAMEQSFGNAELFINFGKKEEAEKEKAFGYAIAALLGEKNLPETKRYEFETVKRIQDKLAGFETAKSQILKANKKKLKKYNSYGNQIQALEKQIEDVKNANIKNMLAELKKRHKEKTDFKGAFIDESIIKYIQKGKSDKEIVGNILKAYSGSNADFVEKFVDDIRQQIYEGSADLAKKITILQEKRKAIYPDSDKLEDINIAINSYSNLLSKVQKGYALNSYLDSDDRLHYLPFYFQQLGDQDKAKEAKKILSQIDTYSDELKKNELSAPSGNDPLDTAKNALSYYEENGQLEAARQMSEKIAHYQSLKEISLDKVSLNTMADVSNVIYIDTKGVSKRDREAIGLNADLALNSENLQKIADRQYLVRKNDNVSSWLRDMDYNKAGKALHFINFIKKYSKLKDDTSTSEVQDAANKIMEQFSSGSSEKLKDNIIKIFGWKNIKTKEWDYVPNTVYNAYGAIGWLYDNKDLLINSMRAAKKHASTKDARNQYFRTHFDESYAKIIEYLNTINGVNKYSSVDKFDQIKLARLNSEINKFAIDLSPLIGSPKDVNIKGLSSGSYDASQILIDLTERSPHIGDKLASKLNISNPVTATRTVAKYMLTMYGDYLDEDTRKKFQGEGYFSKELADQRLVKLLKAIRKENPTVGIPRAVLLSDVSHGSQMLKEFKKIPEAEREKILNSVSSSVANIKSESWTAESLADAIIKKSFGATESVTEKMLQQYGIDLEEARLMLHDREIRKQNLREKYERVFGTLLDKKKNPGIGASFNKATGELLIFSANNANHPVDFSRHIIYDMFDEANGSFYTMIGGRRIAPHLALTGNGVESMFAVPGRETANAVEKHLNASNRPDPEDRIGTADWFLADEEKKSLNPKTVMNEFSDAADRRLSRAVDASDFYARLGQLHDKGVFDHLNLNAETFKVLDNLREKAYDENSSKPRLLNKEDDIQSSQILAVNKDLTVILNEFYDPNSKLTKEYFGDNVEAYRGFVKNYLGKIKLDYNKSPEKMYWYVSERELSAFAIGQDTRHMQNVRERALDIKFSDFIKQADSYGAIEDDQKYRDVLLGGGLFNTPQEAARYKISRNKSNSAQTPIYEYERSYRANWLTVNTDTLTDMVIAAKKDKDSAVAQLKHSEVLLKYINESGSVMDPLLLDMSRKNIIQVFKTENLASINDLQSMLSEHVRNNLIKEEMNRRKATQELVTFVNGEYKFEYSRDNSILLGRGDTIAYYKDYTNEISEEESGSEGFLRKGYFISGKKEQVSEEAINKTINSEKNKKRLNKAIEGITDQNLIDYTLRSTVNDILKEEYNGIQQKYWVQDTDALGYRKMMVEMEKSLSDYMLSGLGYENPRVYAAIGGNLSNMDVVQAVGPLDMQILRGNASDGKPDSDMLERVLRKHGLHLDLSAGGFNSYEEFYNEAVKERRTYYNAAMQTFEKNGLKRKGEYVAGFGNLEHEGAKDSHSEMQRVEQVAGEAIRARAFTISQQHGGITQNEAMAVATQEFVGELNANKVLVDKKGNTTVSYIQKANSINTGDFYTFNIDKFNEIANAFVNEADKNGYESSIKDANGSVIAHRTYAPIRFLSDADRPGYESGGDKGGLRINRRAINNALVPIIDNEIINQIWENDKKLADVIGMDKVKEKFEKYYGGIANIGEDGKVSIDTSQLKEGQKHRVNEDIVKSLNDEVIAGRNTEMRTDYGKYFSNKVTRKLESEGISEESQKHIIDSLHKSGYMVVGADKVKNIYSVARNTEAYYMNKDFMSTSLTDQEKADIVARNTGEGGKFELRTLEDLTQATAKTHINGDPHSIINKSIILDAGEQYKEYGFDTRYLAIGYEPNKKANDTAYASTDMQQLLNTISKRYTQINEIGDITDDKNKGKVEFRQQEISNAVNEIRQGVQGNVENKEGQIAEATSDRLSGSQRMKADIITVEQAQHVEALQKAEIEGMSITERLKKGKRDNIVLVSSAFFENQFEQGDVRDFIKSQNPGITEEKLDKQMASLKGEYLKSLDGKVQEGVEMRWPAEYVGSLNGIYLVKDNTLDPGRAKVIEGTVIQQKMDKDGDLGYISGLREFVASYDSENNRFITTNYRMNKAEAGLFNNGGTDQVKHISENAFDNVKRASDYMEVITGNQGHAYDGDNISEDAYKARDYSKMRIGDTIYNISKLSTAERYENQTRFYKISGTNDFQQAIAEYAQDNNMNPESINPMDIETEHLSGKNGIMARYLRKTGNNANDAEAFATELYNRSTAENEMRQVKGTAGLINNSTYLIERVMNAANAEGVSNLSQGDVSIIEGTLVHLKEMGQAAKNSSSVGQIKPEDVSAAAKSMLGLYGERNQEKFNEIIDSLGNIKELKQEKMPNVSSISFNEDGYVSGERIKQAFANIFKPGKALSSEASQAAMTGFKKTNSKNMELYIGSDTSDLGNVALTAAQSDMESGESIIKNAEMKTEHKRMTPEQTEVQNLQKFREVMPEESFADEDVITNGLKDNLVGTFKQIGKSFKGSHGAMAMLGFAGTMMMAGIAGGAPTSPQSADDQAQGIQQENAMYEIPSTMSGQGTQSGANQSYIINVNASTDKGREFATTAINQAFANIGGAKGNGSMVMNIKDSSSNIGFGDIARYVGSII